ncbi:class II aldolase/adducin family protein [Sphingomonas koreensis]|uniref:Class II aldolase/adducin family protein n=1 Tax=Sphingomonas koreensis TaxID=93064 RepID=A0A430G7X7_9SPHN|nr:MULTISPECIES: class II aldolase/adducin family protein [Sphingomonas]MDK2768947.1 class II aldolase/adducin family protein [Sphingomonas sp.]PZU59981.1 MAG: class II aldolase [Sphingobium sp.]RSY89536.1 class II aldolase/adducin family protein [Sphingomonas koreensis]
MPGRKVQTKASHPRLLVRADRRRTSGMNPIERDTRIALAACYRLIARYGMTDLIFNHITARIPNTEDLLINPFGLLYEEITASSLVRIDIEGNVLDPGDTDYGINRAGYVIHSAVHSARPDVQAVIHTHTRAGVAVSCMPQGLMPISQTALRFLGRTGYHDFEGPAIDEGERVRLIAALGANDALILRNHGLLTVGRSIPEAFLLMQRLETACQIQVAALAGGAPVMPSAESQRRTAALFAPKTGSADVSTDGGREWPALLRQLDRADPRYRD